MIKSILSLCHLSKQNNRTKTEERKKRNVKRAILLQPRWVIINTLVNHKRFKLIDKFILKNY